MRSTPFRPLRPILLLATFALAACDGATGPRALDEAGLRADLSAASAAVSNAATSSLGTLGPEISAAIGGLGVVADLPASLLEDPSALVAREELRARLLDRDASVLADIPHVALGKTFVYDTLADGYVVSARAGAPANGVRFILYAVDTAADVIQLPLVETGYADLTRTITNQAIVARVEAYAGVASVVKVLDYSAAVSGTIVAPQIVVSGFAKNATDSLTFSLTSAISLATSTISIDWIAAVPSRGLVSRVQQTLSGGQIPSVTIDGRLSSHAGDIGIVGTIVQTTGGILTVKVNGKTFATIAVDSFDDETPTILNAQGQPLTDEQQDMLEDIMDWFEDAFDFYEDLLDPVEHLLDFVTP